MPSTMKPRSKSEQALNSLIQQHPLQRLASPSRTISACVHILGLASYASSFDYLVGHPNHINQAYGWHFQYLTIIGLSLATLTFSLGLVADVTLHRGAFAAKNVISMCAAPMEVLISTLYWGLRAIDPALVVPPDLELPLSADLGFHLAPTAFLLLDILLLSPPWTIAGVPACVLSSVIAFLYWFWIEACFRQNGFYPYPLFELLDNSHRVALFGGCAAVMAVITLLLKRVYAVVNGAGSEWPGKLR
ncbi:uncharacterized protein A1O9_01010 [Exophiala aquamarina CBS 119918]|uniref:FAR-17a/AIG1-like protein n=1 Tax=Exophiala aquamarina CBS 119918 TaxID=1182545 RepID=A0A072PSE6_9EURO|nr:uncharacterized protein A1O9_01010 [Exophiala aquamarina CBS 119918]KEF63034.1 hypothetical protein A1O9_01010 [Exophiala aquamarina CBS 119918]